MPYLIILMLSLVLGLSACAPCPDQTQEDADTTDTQITPMVDSALDEQMPAFDIGQTVVKMPISDDVSMDEAIESMELRANEINMKKVAHQPLSQELIAMGEENVRRMEIFQFCDPKIAKDMIAFNMDFGAYMPCRIMLIEDEEGKGWLVMMDLDFFISSSDLPPELQEMGMKVRDDLLNIMDAGANGEF